MTACSDDGSNSIRVAINGSLSMQEQTTVGGSWTISNVQVTDGDVVTVFVDNTADANEAVAVMVGPLGSESSGRPARVE